MKKLILLACIIPFLGFAQVGADARIRKTHFELTGGAGVSYFVYSSSKIKEHFASPDFRFGALANRSISDRISLQYGLRLGVRLKTASLNYNPTYVNVNTFPRVEKIDETSSQSDQYFFEIPVAVNYKVNKLGFSLGATYKNYIWSDNYRYTNYTSSIDVGITLGVSYQLTPRWRVGVEYYGGLIRFTESMATDQSLNSFTYKGYSRFAQVSIAYSLRKR